eukprot:TRINITY_DN24846_c0_g3_i3.p1 TRINITY_DN24846_c0_g3~~TRINITY_DN24846_c0_g3_i3.p1  ORF type:complete len:129 (-),score=18.62 TRINITY_DN24846_c0_g3_i3:268-633(-)
MQTAPLPSIGKELPLLSLSSTPMPTASAPRRYSLQHPVPCTISQHLRTATATPFHSNCPSPSSCTIVPPSSLYFFSSLSPSSPPALHLHTSLSSLFPPPSSRQCLSPSLRHLFHKQRHKFE